eukprot:5306365-Alexandrium_andersonii.AAC.1
MKAKQNSAEMYYAHLAKANSEDRMGMTEQLMRGAFKLEYYKLAVKGLSYLTGEQNGMKATWNCLEAKH